MKRPIPILAVLIFLLFSCSIVDQGSDETTSAQKPGQFAIQQANGLAKVISKQSDSSVNIIDSIRSSRSFYYLLKNVGEAPITDIKISSSNTAFDISPKSIEKLISETITSTDASLVPIIRLDITHGYAINGTGWKGLLKQGINTCTLMITGNTTSHSGKDTIVTLQVDLSVFALIAELTFKADGETLDMSEKNECIGVVGEPIFGPCFTADSIIIINTGNVKVIVSVPNEIDSTTMDISDSLVLHFTPGEDKTVGIWPSNTISDIYQFPQNDEGWIKKMLRNNEGE